MRLQGFPWKKLQTCEFLAFYYDTYLAFWHVVFFKSIVQMGFEGRDAGVAVRGERE